MRYENAKLEKLCTNERERKRRRADALARRHTALSEAHHIDELKVVDPNGDWHSLSGDRRGHWAGRLSRNRRLIVRPEGGGDGCFAVVVTTVEIVDYHQ